MPEIDITPEPSDEERTALAIALERLRGALDSDRSPWTAAALREAVAQDGEEEP
jgi:hypothetical protein